MRVGTAHKTGSEILRSRTARSIGLATFLLFCGSQGFEKAVAASDTRTISLHHIHTGEDISVTYMKNGQFDEAGLKRLNWFMRDWRKERDVRMEPHLIDLLWEVQQEFGGKAIHVVCGFRSPETNSMLRARSSGVARTSLHMQGKATDFFIPGVPVEAIRNAALRIQGGGVGYYPTSGSPFVHMDVGSVRHWPRMTRDQLVRVFPDGRTIHVPTDGNPLPGYQLALADGERNLAGGSARAPKRNLIASLFGGKDDQEETGDNDSVRSTAATPRRAAPAVVAVAAPAKPETVATVPLPQVRPAAFRLASAESKPAPMPVAMPAAAPAPAPRPIYQIASAESRPAPAPRPLQAAGLLNLASLSPNEIITQRGYWQGLPDQDLTNMSAAETQAAAPAKTARRFANTQVASADPNNAGPFLRNDRIPSDLALAYAAQETPSSVVAARSVMPPRAAPAAVVTTKGAASVAAKPAVAELVQPVRAADRLNDPWVRGVMIARSIQNSMVTTTFGAPDLTGLRPYLAKPASSVMMTFSSDPYLGMTTDGFTGSAVVFQPTVTFGMRTAALQ